MTLKGAPCIPYLTHVQYTVHTYVRTSGKGGHCTYSQIHFVGTIEVY